MNEQIGFDIGEDDEEVEIKSHTFSVSWEYNVFRDTIYINEAVDVFGDDITKNENKTSLIKNMLRAKYSDQIREVINELSSKLPDPEDTVKCWLCKGQGENKESRYHNRKVMVKCDKCGGSGEMKFKEVENTHRKQYL